MKKELAPKLTPKLSPWPKGDCPHPLEEKPYREFAEIRNQQEAGRRKSRPQLWMTPRQSRYFPQRLKALADDIEKLNANSRFFLGRKFMELPGLLRNYADQLAERRKLLAKPHASQKSQALDCLRHLMKLATGKEHLADLARILREANPSNLTDWEDALKKRAHRNPLK